MTQYAPYPFPKLRKPADAQEIQSFLTDFLPVDGDWQDQAACASSDPDLWHPHKGESPTPARTICAGCPVLEDCRSYALNVTDPLQLHGVWGGLTREERLVIVGRRKPRTGQRDVAA